MKNSIKLIVTDRTPNGYNHVSTIVNPVGGNKDCGMLYLSDDELEQLSDVLRAGCNSVGSMFELEDTTRYTVEDY